jgi:hypothetical protein
MSGLASVLVLAAATTSAVPAMSGGVGVESSAAAMLPAPPEASHGEVPLSSPIAPIPPGISPWAITLSAFAGIADPFYDKVATLLSVRRGFGSVALELWGGEAFSWAGAALSLCTNPNACVSPSPARLGATPGDLGALAGASLVWRAAEGKMSLGGFGSHRFGLELSLGAAALQYTIVQNHTESLWAPGVRAGLGVEGSITNAVALRADLQAIVYPTNIRGTWSAENQLFAGLTFAWHAGGP